MDIIINFKGVWLPKKILLDKELNFSEKVFLAEILHLDNNIGCTATNRYFSSIFKISISRCTKIITSLYNKNYIIRNVQNKELNKKRRILKVINKNNYL